MDWVGDATLLLRRIANTIAAEVLAALLEWERVASRRLGFRWARPRRASTSGVRRGCPRATSRELVAGDFVSEGRPAILIGAGASPACCFARRPRS